ncbi:Tyrosine-protein kinase Tec [Acipenser ruthenus]|uniref:non-specific protein-tyrosine kinase n=1 Tax=Acipenser ruthenus TaxID=7906 RepID=A0A444TWS0_ACIRT|nr:Tyrosine-protein kinase Tec [Acipenser ruthenus]
MPMFWIFPYFFESRIKECFPTFTMLDYQVDYENHALYKHGKTGRRQSPVRIFTNLSPGDIVLPAVEGYRFCSLCQRYVSSENKHCDICSACTSKKKSKKGYVDIQKIKCAEIVKTDGGIIPCQNKYPFQVVYDANTLYIFAPNNDSRSAWVQNLKEEIRNNSIIVAKFHPQFWNEGVWLCCRQAEKLAPGCEEYNLFGDISRKPLPPTPNSETLEKPRRLPPPPPPIEEHTEDSEEEKEKVVIAMYDFEAVETHDLNLVQGEEYVIILKCDIHWYKARDKYGQEGYIPSNYVTEKKSNNLDQYPWYCKIINRNKAEQQLKTEVLYQGYDTQLANKEDKWEINPSDLTFMKELGCGQYGVVRLGKWRAQHKVAIKAIREGAMYEEDFIEEAKVMMKLSHPKLVQLYGVCTQQKPIYIVTEFMEHGCLLNYIRQRRGNFSQGMLISICQDAARNCLVNDSLVVKVSDFGMTRYVLDDQYTSSSGAKFPVKWSPPEVFNFCKYSSKSDVWSFGVLMWEVFTEGKMPFENNPNHEHSHFSQSHRSRRKPPPPPPEEEEEDEDQMEVIAMYDFVAKEPTDLTLQQGQEYIILHKKDQHWWKARDVKYGVDLGDIRHYQIKQKGLSQFFLAEKHVFNSIPEVIRYHQHNAAGLVTRLRYPVGPMGKCVPATAGFSYEKWEINPSELSIMEELGSGQFGVVRLGKWRALCKVAIKTINEGSMSEEDFIEEAKVMTKLSHPKLVQLYGVCIQQKPICIVTEFLENGCLLNYLQQRQGCLKKEFMLAMCHDACEGMEYLETNGFIHRDLAARNCLVSKKQVVKVCDFGMTRYVLDNQYISSTGSKFPVKWSPPEVFHYNKYSSKSDVWSFGK